VATTDVWSQNRKGGPQVRDDAKDHATPDTILACGAQFCLAWRGLAHRGARAYWSLSRGPGGGSGPAPSRGRVGFSVTTTN
jgi:hypothetical protein